MFVDTCLENERERLDGLLDRASILCVSPLVRNQAGLASGHVPVYEIWNKINEQSINMLREYLR